MPFRICDDPLPLGGDHALVLSGEDAVINTSERPQLLISHGRVVKPGTLVHSHLQTLRNGCTDAGKRFHTEPPLTLHA